MLSERERTALAHYEERARAGFIDPTPIWADSFSQSIFHQMSEGGSFIDVGCGEGKLIQMLPDLGVADDSYLGVDISPAQVNLARKLNPEHKFEVGSMYEIGGRYPEQFDGFWCACVLMHLPRERLPEALRSLRSCVRPGAVGLVSTPFGEGDAQSVTGVTLTLYRIGELEDAFSRAGFEAFFHSPDMCQLLGSIRAL